LGSTQEPLAFPEKKGHKGDSSEVKKGEKVNIRFGRWLMLALILPGLNGCGLVYTNVRFPYSYRSATPVDVHASKNDPVATGEGCSTSVLYLAFWGDSGYAAATRKALENYPDGTLYDVKADAKLKSYLLGLYTRACTTVTGKVARP